MAEQSSNMDIAMDAASLYREESFTDRRVGTIQVLTPVTPQGDIDTARSVMFVGQTQVMTPAGALPLNFEISAGSLEDAIERFGDEAKQALNNTMQKLEELRREAASSLIVPGTDGAGGIPPGGGIQMP